MHARKVTNRSVAKRSRGSDVLTRKDVIKIVQRQAELKIYSNTTDVADAFGGQLEDLTANIVKGDGGDTRDGNKIKVKKVLIHFQCDNSHAGRLFGRLMVLRAKQSGEIVLNNDPIPEVFIPLKNGGPAAYTILWDKFFGLQANGTFGDQKTFQISLDVDAYTTYLDGQNTDPLGGIKLYFDSDAAAASEISCKYGYSITYTDV